MDFDSRILDISLKGVKDEKGVVNKRETKLKRRYGIRGASNLQREEVVAQKEMFELLFTLKFNLTKTWYYSDFLFDNWIILEIYSFCRYVLCHKKSYQISFSSLKEIHSETLYEAKIEFCVWSWDVHIKVKGRELILDIQYPFIIQFDLISYISIYILDL